MDTLGNDYGFIFPLDSLNKYNNYNKKLFIIETRRDNLQANMQL